MNSESNIGNIIGGFNAIGLKDMDKVRLMRRTDTKYVFNKQLLGELLKRAKDSYFVVEIKDEREQQYETVYFDTEDYKMYNVHHNGKLNRHKVRIRKYVFNDQQFLEIKRKNNKGETIKKRVPHPIEENMMGINGLGSFVDENSPYFSNSLEPKLANNFVRITLVNTNFSERITLDYNINFKDLASNASTLVENICIAEIKRDKDNKNSTFSDILREMRVLPMGFSKYCVGLSLLNNNIKRNLFKNRLRNLATIERNYYD